MRLQTKISWYSSYCNCWGGVDKQGLDFSGKFVNWGCYDIVGVGEIVEIGRNLAKKYMNLKELGKFLVNQKR